MFSLGYDAQAKARFVHVFRSAGFAAASSARLPWYIKPHSGLGWLRFDHDAIDLFPSLNFTKFGLMNLTR
jgi:hypothetical protein